MKQNTWHDTCMVRRWRRCLTIVAALVAAAFLAPGAMAAAHTDSKLSTSDTRGPKMTILKPAEGAALRGEKFILQAEITGVSEPPRLLRLFIVNDSKPVKIELANAVKGTAPKVHHVGPVIKGPLAMGSNTLVLIAEDSSGNRVAEASVSVNRVRGPLFVYKLILVVALYLFLPLTAVTYYAFRRNRRLAEVDRIFYILKFDEESKKAYEYEPSDKGERDKGEHWHLSWAVMYLSVVSFIGLALLFFSAEIALPGSEFPQVKLGNVYFPEKGSRLVSGMAFLGAYLWGIQSIYRRYLLNDIIPGAYYGISTRMILAAIIALVTYNGYEALAGGAGPGTSEGGIMWSIWPALALAIGMFPQRGLRWLMDRLPIFSPATDPSVREAPLEMIEGMTIQDIMRLEEQGIDTCYDLAKADFVPLILKTPYSARELVDWILQAKLCAYFGEAVGDLRRHSIKTAYDLTQVDDIEKLAPETTLTRSALLQAKKSLERDNEIGRLREAAELLGKFWRREASPLSEGEKESS